MGAGTGKTRRAKASVGPELELQAELRDRPDYQAGSLADAFHLSKLYEYEQNGKDGAELSSAPITREDGRVEWHTLGCPEGFLHREDGPAVENPDGSKEWWLLGQLHRDDAPAITRADGTKHWYRHGEQHRDDGPAFESAEGSLAWYVDGKPHRVGGPAKDWNDGTKKWFQNGLKHREDGPAVEEPYGYKEWWLRGVRVSEEDVELARIAKRFAEHETEELGKVTF